MSNPRLMCGSEPRCRCAYQCGSCGFNPKEAKRRMEQGRFERVEVTYILTDDDGKTLHAITKTVFRLRFPPKK